MITFNDGKHADRIQFLAIRYCEGLDAPKVAASGLFTLPELSQVQDVGVAALLWKIVEGTAPE